MVVSVEVRPRHQHVTAVTEWVGDNFPLHNDKSVLNTTPVHVIASTWLPLTGQSCCPAALVKYIQYV